MAINQKQVLSLQQKLSPQQIQMIKLLELPTVQLEQTTPLPIKAVSITTRRTTSSARYS